MNRVEIIFQPVASTPWECYPRILIQNVEKGVEITFKGLPFEADGKYVFEGMKLFDINRFYM